jgi:hypothetical protein
MEMSIITSWFRSGTARGETANAIARDEGPAGKPAIYDPIQLAPAVNVKPIFCCDQALPGGRKASADFANEAAL